MITQAENDLMTRVGKGTPAGELLRRYWHPVALAAELTAEKPTQAVTILGEKLVVFRQPPKPGETQPSYGLIQEHCPHRRASFAYGTPDCEGIRCRYHGWKFAADGHCLETPAEPVDSPMKSRTHAMTYPVQKLAGLLWAYMGPQPAPLLPRWDVLAREDGRRWIVAESQIDCNWLQAMENSVDPAHLYWLHSASAHLGDWMKHYDEKHDFIKFEYGIYKRRTTPGKNAGDAPRVDEHPLVFPCTLRHVANDIARRDPSKRGFRHNLQIRVPIDDERIKVYRVNFVPSETDRSPPDVDPPHEYRPLKNEKGEYYMDIVSAQDSMAWESQGAIADRTQETLGASDVGIAILRRLLREQIEIVRNGGEPMGVIRDAAKNRVIYLDVVNERMGLFRGESRPKPETVDA
jgi:5,5'-dehydrodivanillate O-demethylase